MLGGVGSFSDIWGGFLSMRTVAAPRVEVGATTVTPLAKVVLVRVPGAAVIRSRPAAVLASANGQVSRTAIRDMTRVVQAGVAVMTVLCICFLAIRASTAKEAQP